MNISIEEYKIFFERELKKILPSEDDPLYDPVKYSLLSRGKRIRPMLLMSVATFFSRDYKKVIRPALSIECIHTYSLIHDDLPCMDNDSLRRGKPCLHIAFKEDIALLTGDYLLTYAFELLLTAKGLREDEKVRLGVLLAKAAGRAGMIAGQVLDMRYSGQNVTKNIFKKVHTLKTGALIKCAIEMGALLGGASSKELAKMSIIGDCVGEAFQIMDDLEDMDQNDSLNFAQSFGCQKAEQRVEELYEKIEDQLETFSYDVNHFRRMLHGFVFRKEGLASL